MPAFGQDAGTVNTTVSVPPAPAPCITGVPASIPYGTAPFSKPGINKFVHRLQGILGPTPLMDLQTTNQVLLSGAASGPLPVLDSILYLPCVGSAGAGSTASADIVFTAVIP